MHTEAEAAKRMCPKPTPDCFRCAGSMCMAWRWVSGIERQTIPVFGPVDDKGFPRPGHLASWEFVPAKGDKHAAWVEPLEEAQARALGFCGLAGTPPHVVAGVIRSQVRGE